MCSKHFYNVVELSAIKNTRGMWQLWRMCSCRCSNEAADQLVCLLAWHKLTVKRQTVNNCQRQHTASSTMRRDLKAAPKRKEQEKAESPRQRAGKMGPCLE